MNNFAEYSYLSPQQRNISRRVCAEKIAGIVGADPNESCLIYYIDQYYWGKPLESLRRELIRDYRGNRRY